MNVSVDIRNTGKRKGREVVQLYIRDNVATVVPREKMLRDFSSVTLMPGEQKTVNFTLPPEAFKIYNNKMQYVVEPGEFVIMVEPDSQRLSSRKVLVRADGE